MKYHLGFCAWLLQGTLPEKVNFLHKNHFNAISFLQNVIYADPSEKAEAAAAIREHKMILAFHGNVHANLKDNALDEEFVERLFSEVLWWNQATDGAVYDCCSDAVSTSLPEGGTKYNRQLTEELFTLEADTFEKSSIYYGIENSFTPGGYSTIAAFSAMNQLPGCRHKSGMLFDVGHANIQLTSHETNHSLVDYMRAIPFRLHEIHISDNHGTKDEHLMPGFGSVDFGALRSGMEAINFDGIVSLEACKDIGSGIYAWNQNDPLELKTILNGRDFLMKILS